MANEVYANGMEIACKAGTGKVIAAFPDVCMTPPENPATPPGIPVPYLNTGFASDTTGGSKNVKISYKEIMLKNKSCFKTSTGDEAGCAAKKGVVSSKNKGKVYFIKWSMDVKLEGKNVDRHFDMTTNNHGSPTANEAVPWLYTDKQVLSPDSKCGGDIKKKADACEGKEEPHCPGVLSRNTEDLKKQVKLAPTKRRAEVRALDSGKIGKESRTSKAAKAATKEANNDECVKKSRCQLKPYVPLKRKGQPECCPGQRPHHIPPQACFKGKGVTVKKYNKDRALCVCMEGTSQHYGSHGKNHAAIDFLAGANGIKPNDNCTIADYNNICAAAVAKQCGCDPECIEQQLSESLKPTNRKIRHAHSKSNHSVSDKDKAALKKKFKALSKALTGR